MDSLEPVGAAGVAGLLGDDARCDAACLGSCSKDRELLPFSALDIVGEHHGWCLVSPGGRGLASLWRPVALAASAIMMNLPFLSCLCPTSSRYPQPGDSCWHAWAHNPTQSKSATVSVVEVVVVRCTGCGTCFNERHVLVLTWGGEGHPRQTTGHHSRGGHSWVLAPGAPWVGAPGPIMLQCAT
jgi:hypothetical protein